MRHEVLLLKILLIFTLKRSMLETKTQTNDNLLEWCQLR